MIESTCKNSNIGRKKTRRFDYKSDLDYEYYQNYRLIFHYKFYIIRTFGSEVWTKLIGMTRFKETFYESIQTYGETILQTLVGYTGLVLDVTIEDLLKYFIAYRRKVQTFPFNDFTYFD